MIIIMHCPYGEPEKIVAFTAEKDAVNYTKKHLTSWDIYNEQYQEDVANMQSIEDAQVIIEENAIYTLQVWVVDEIDPKDIK